MVSLYVPQSHEHLGTCDRHFLLFYSPNLDDDLRVKLYMDQSCIRTKRLVRNQFDEISPQKASNGIQTVIGDGQTAERDGEVSNPTSARDTTAQTKMFATAFVNNTQ